jgi:hypothetical protein
MNMVLKSLNDEPVEKCPIAEQTPFVAIEIGRVEACIGFEKSFEFSKSLDPIIVEQERLKEIEQDAFLMKLIELYGNN